MLFWRMVFDPMGQMPESLYLCTLHQSLLWKKSNKTDREEYEKIIPIFVYSASQLTILASKYALIFLRLLIKSLVVVVIRIFIDKTVRDQVKHILLNNNYYDNVVSESQNKAEEGEKNKLLRLGYYRPGVSNSE